MTAGEALVRRVTPDDWRALRALRLEALRDTPTAYLESAEEAEALDDDAWRARARRGAAGDDVVQVMAFDGPAPVATAVGAARDGVPSLLAVYVTPRARGAGLLARLVEEVAAWHRGAGARTLHLQVHEDNARALRAYARLGFVLTGVRRPHPPDPRRDELEMAVPLTGAGSGAGGPVTAGSGLG